MVLEYQGGNASQGAAARSRRDAALPNTDEIASGDPLRFVQAASAPESRSDRDLRGRGPDSTAAKYRWCDASDRPI